MTADLEGERWPRRWELFDEARSRSRAGGERERFLAEACAGDAELARELTALLTASETADPLLDSRDRDWVAPLLADAAGRAALPPTPAAGVMVGAWRLGRLLGEGGMGAVFEAERNEAGFSQSAAVKLLRGGGLSPLLRERFVQERRILARLEHPGIARFLDGGLTPDGVPWFALERVEGRPITRWCREERASVARRLVIILEVCDAVAYAHRNLVVHRDLKPSNILVDATGRVRLLDFGIAKLLGPGTDTGETAARTLFGAMTPEYAAPEQRLGGPVTTATDVYALGLLLFELLAGRLPTRLQSEAELERPSSAALAEPERPEGRSLAGRLRGDLDRIVARAVATEPERRYPSAEALADDLRRHREGLPVRARDAAVGYRVAKFVRRHRLAVLAALVVVLTLVGGLRAALWQGRQAAQAAERERRERERAESALAFVTSLFATYDPAQAKGRVFTDREMLSAGAERVERELAPQPELQIPLWKVIASVHLQRGEYDLGEPLARRLLTAEIRRHGPVSLEAAKARQFFAEFLFFADRYRESLAYYRASVAVHERDGATRDDDYLDALSGIAACRRELGEPAAAESFQLRALALARELHGEASVQFSSAANSLVNMMPGRDAEKLPYARAAVAGFRQALGEDHPSTLIAALNLTILEWNLGHGREARATLSPVAPALVRILGPDHLQTVIARRIAAGFAEEDGDFARAEQTMSAVLDTLERTSGLDSRAYAYAAIQAAYLYWRSGELAAAEESARAACAHFRATEPEHSNAAWAEATLARILVARGRLVESGALVARALAVDVRSGATDSNFHADVLDAAGELALARGDRAAARLRYESSLALRRRFSPDGSRATALTLSGLGRALEGEERGARCRTLLAEAVAIYGRLLATGHPERLAAERQLAACPPSPAPSR